MRWLEQPVRENRDSSSTMIEVLPGPGEAGSRWSYRDVFDAVFALAERLRQVAAAGGSRPQVGLLAHNTPAWLVADLACLVAGVIEVPVPLAFSRDQAASLLRETSLCLADEAGAQQLARWGAKDVLPPWAEVQVVDVAALTARGRGLPVPPLADADWVCKVIHTSGTTSDPKGVRIRAEGLGALLGSLHQRMPPGSGERFLSLVPLSLLIEQVAACYLPLLSGGTTVLLPQRAPLIGTAPGAAAELLRYIQLARPSGMQGPPMLYEGFAAIADAHPGDTTAQLAQRLFGRPEPAFLACGGAPVSPNVLSNLWQRGIRVYEGYGLSENSSVVSWNTPGSWRLGSVGRPLDHVTARIAADGELLIKSTSLFDGYTRNDPSSCQVDPDGWLHTGDLAGIDDDGFIYIRGRKKNVIITAAGRNIAPDWVASRYRELPEVEAAVVFGDRLDELVGFFVLASGYDEADARRAIEEFGATQLSGVERVSQIHLVLPADPSLDGLFTVTGRPVRERIWQLITEKGNVHA
jgi:long-chain acyl-CoA synthetase